MVGPNEDDPPTTMRRGRLPGRPRPRPRQTRRPRRRGPRVLTALLLPTVVVFVAFAAASGRAAPSGAFFASSSSSSSSAPNPRARRRTIVGGTETIPNRYPYMSSLVAPFSGGHQCGGALIAPDVVLTAAHCLNSFSSIELNRHDLFDESEVYESYVVERAVFHPEYLYENVQDDHDFAAVKFYGRTELNPVRVNRNSTSPSVEGEEMLVFGWGSTVPDVSSVRSGALMEVTVDYVPYDTCAEAWKTSAYLVSDAVICAADDGEDSCNGDSGGPLIEYDPADPPDASGDVLVGLVSSGTPVCADPAKPALYARVSAVWEWIRSTTCELSHDPPADFDCPATSVTTPPPPSSETTINVTVEIRFDSHPEETGYVVQSTSKLTGRTTLMRHRPIFAYLDSPDFSTVRETFELRNDAVYDFVLLDRVGDGMYSGSSGHYRIYHATVDDGDGAQVSIVNETKFWTYDTSQTSTFVLGNPVTYQPTSSPVPTKSSVPTPTPLPYVTLVIKFDSYPREIGHTLERILSPTEATNGHEDKTELIDCVPTGTYKAAKYKNSLRTIVIELSPKSYVDQIYRFNVTDVGGDGLCCSYGNGYWQLWLGDPPGASSSTSSGGGTKLGSGAGIGPKGVSVEFVLEALPSEKPTVRPSRVPSSSPTEADADVQTNGGPPTVPAPASSSSPRGRRGTTIPGGRWRSFATSVAWATLCVLATTMFARR